MPGFFRKEYCVHFTRDVPVRTGIRRYVMGEQEKEEEEEKEEKEKLFVDRDVDSGMEIFGVHWEVKGEHVKSVEPVVLMVDSELP